MALTTYRCVTANGVDGEVICIGIDESQGGQDYNSIGLWANFTFYEIPQPQNELLEFVNTNNYMGSLLKVVDNQVVLKTLEEVNPV
jgi:hypothetical protein